MRIEDSGSTIVEERIVMKPHGETVIKTYLQGKHLGKGGGVARCYEFTDLEIKKVLAAKCIAKSTLMRSRAKQ